MKNFILCALAASSLSVGGCAVVTSSMPSLINTTGEAWYTEAIGFFGMTWGSKVWYCPPPAAGPARRAKRPSSIPMTKEEEEAQRRRKRASSPLV